MNPDSNTSQQGNNFNITRLKVIIILTIIIGGVYLFESCNSSSDNQAEQKNDADTTTTWFIDLFKEEKVWTAPDSATIPQNDSGKLILYGRRLAAG